MEIWIIEKLNGSDSALLTKINEVLNEENSQEAVSFLQNDPSFEPLMKGLGVNTPPAVIFLVPVGKDKYVVLDRIFSSTSKQEIRQRYLAARENERRAGEPGGQLQGELVDVQSFLEGKDSETPLGFGYFGIGLDWPWWLWFGIAGLTALKATESNKTQLLWWGLTGAAIYNGIQKRKS